MIQVKQAARIDNPREYEASAVDHLRYLLETGSWAQRDPQRENFYEIEGQDETYYIHISPISGGVVLLAKWLRQPEVCSVASEHLAP